MKTLDVIFRMAMDPVWKCAQAKSIRTAIFPSLPGTADPWTACCYAHLGQHGSCSIEWYRTTRPADPDEYAALLAELTSIYSRDHGPDDPPITLRVVKRWTQHHDAARKAALEDARK